VNRKNKIIFFSVYFLAAALTAIRFFRNSDPLTLSGLFIILLFQILLFLVIYFGSQKKPVFRTNSDRPKLTKEMGVLRAFLICSLVFCGSRILMQSVYMIYPLIGQHKTSGQVDQNILDILTESAPKGVNAWLELTAGSVSLTGIFLIWKMKRLGFYVFILGESYFYFDLISEMIDKKVQLPGAIVVGWEMMWPVWDLVFIVMCAGQLKHLTWSLKPLSKEVAT
jgi:hypothetical protein